MGRIDQHIDLEVQPGCNKQANLIASEAENQVDKLGKFETAPPKHGRGKVESRSAEDGAKAMVTPKLACKKMSMAEDEPSSKNEASDVAIAVCDTSVAQRSSGWLDAQSSSAEGWKARLHCALELWIEIATKRCDWEWVRDYQSIG